MTRPDGPALELRDLTKRFGDFTAVDHLTLTVPPGEVVGLLGFNGAGKSTTMEMLATLLPPTSGTAKVAGFDVVREALQVRRRLAIVFESAVPARPHWTVEEYLRFFATLRGAPSTDPDADVVGLLELEPLLGSVTGTLSAGQRKRVELARALSAHPQVLLLDEPTKEVDLRGKRRVWDAVRAEARRRGMAVLLTTHDALEVREMCDSVLVMQRGRVTATLSGTDISGSDPARLESLLVARMGGA